MCDLLKGKGWERGAIRECFVRYRVTKCRLVFVWSLFVYMVYVDSAGFWIRAKSVATDSRRGPFDAGSGTTAARCGAMFN